MPRATPAPIPQNKIHALQINRLANLSRHPSDGLIMREGRSNRGRFAGVDKRDRRAVGLARVQRCTPNARQVQAARSRRDRFASRVSLVATP